MTTEPFDDFFLGCVDRANEAPVSGVRPFIKWVGGKGQLLGPIRNIFPRQIKTYFEPFLGGGAVFFGFAAEDRFRRAVLNDWNSELVDTYCVVRDFPTDLFPVLAQLKIDYLEAPEETFHRERAKDPKELTPLFRAARFIFLNRTGFNGMYRVNKKGGFNVPWGKYKNPAILNEPLLLACSEVLRTTVIHNGDFSKVVTKAKPGDAVYFDPPYVPVNETSNFTGYTADGFTHDDQKRLATLFRKLAEKDIAVVLSNSDVPIVRELYEGFEIHIVPARRNINSKGDKRGPVNEVLVVGRNGTVREIDQSSPLLSSGSLRPVKCSRPRRP